MNKYERLCGVKQYFNIYERVRIEHWFITFSVRNMFTYASKSLEPFSFVSAPGTLPNNRCFLFNFRSLHTCISRFFFLLTISFRWSFESFATHTSHTVHADGKTQTGKSGSAHIKLSTKLFHNCIHMWFFLFSSSSSTTMQYPPDLRDKFVCVCVFVCVGHK